MILGTLVEIEQRVTHLLKFMFDFYLLVFEVRRTSDFRPPFAHRVQNFVTPGHIGSMRRKSKLQSQNTGGRSGSRAHSASSAEEEIEFCHGQPQA